ncbi:MAG: SDR family oxidoreductase [Novosphingobium sp.]|nr:SDR family oxidoreductase [Novosphingobium sp.]
MAGHHALVTGAHGIVGLNLVQELASRDDWKVTATGRRDSSPVREVDYVAADLTDASGLRTALAGCGDVTHLFFGAFRYNPDPLEETAVNMAILENTLDALQSAGAPLQRVVNYQGGKAYGALYGSVRAPAREIDPRVPGPLFYYDQEDMLYERGAKQGFATTILRPDYVQGIGLGSYVSIVNTLAAYGTICKAMGQPLYFPGGEEAFHALFQMTDARLLARGTIWAASEPHSDNALYNITNGDLFRWANVWERVGDYFGVPTGRPLAMDMGLFMRDKGPVWAELKREHGLVLDLADIQDWSQGYILSSNLEMHSSTIRIRKAGFSDCLDTEDRLFELFDEMKARRYIP